MAFTAALVVTLVASTAGAATAAWAVSESIERAGDVARREEYTAYLVSGVAVDVSRLRTDLFEALAASGPQADLEIESARQKAASARAHRDALPPLLGAGELSLWRTLQPRLDRMLDRLEGVIAAVDRGEDGLARGLLDESSHESHRLFDDLEDFRRISLAETEHAVAGIETGADRMLRIASLGGLALVAVLAFVWGLILRLVAAQRRALAARMAALEVANRELEAFSGRVAHDMRNVLAPIQLGVGALDATSSDPGVLRIAERIGRSCLRGRDLVESLLAFSRAAGRPRTAPQGVGIARELADVLDQLDQPIREAKVEVVQRVPEHAHVAVAPALFHVVLVNLVGNALKFMQEGSERRLTVEAHESEGCWRIRVGDTGPGIPQREIGRVFEPLYRGARAKGTGVGLGLATVKRITESHGGRIEIASVPGRGTTVTVILPRAAPVGSKAEDVAVQAPRPEPSGPDPAAAVTPGE